MRRTQFSTARLFHLPRGPKRLLVMAVDVAIVVISVLLAVWLRLGELPEHREPVAVLAGVTVTMTVAVFAALGLYRQVLRASGIRSVLAIARGAAAVGVIVFMFVWVRASPEVPLTVGIILPILVFVLVGTSRIVARAWAEHALAQISQGPRPHVLVYGAGSAGRQIAAALHNSSQMRVVAFLDDDPALHRSTLNGIPVFDPARVDEVSRRFSADEVLLAVPSASQCRRKRIIEAMRSAHLRVRTVPGIHDIVSGRVTINDVRDLDINELLGRDPVQPCLALLDRNLRKKVVLVTGAGGSIGSELCRQALALEPSTLVLVDSCEYALYQIHAELAEMVGLAFPATKVVPLLGSVTDPVRMRSIITTWRPAMIYHAAAYKHVPIVEHNPVEGARNNLYGTHTVARIAGEVGVERFILVSTDKAVRPTSVMGASKRAAELAVQAHAQQYPSTCFTIVRFGNVLGSSGSVVPLFRRQIGLGGPLTITDSRITRYFMSIPEAAQLVIQAGAMGQGGEVFVLNMGEPVRIADFARRMVEMSGLSVRDNSNPDGDIEIVEIGLRPGEKLYEELLIGDDMQATQHPRIFKASEPFLTYRRFMQSFARLERGLAEANARAVIAVLQEMVAEFTPSGDLADRAALEGGDGLRDAQLFSTHGSRQRQAPILPLSWKILHPTGGSTAIRLPTPRERNPSLGIAAP